MMQLAFAVLALVTIAGAIGVVSSRSVFTSAVWLITSLMGVAGLYVTLDAPFLGVIQVLVYVGAISVLILFAVMLTPNLMESPMQLNRQASLGVAAAMLVFATVSAVAFGAEWPVQPAGVLPMGGGVVAASAAPEGSLPAARAERLPYTSQETVAGETVTKLPDPTVMLGKSFMSDQLLAFELISVILLVALLGAIVIARD